MFDRSVRVPKVLANDAVAYLVEYAYALDPRMDAKFDNIKVVVNNLRGPGRHEPMLGLEDDDRMPNVIWVKWKFDSGAEKHIMVPVSQAVDQDDEEIWWPNRLGSRVVEKGKRMVETFGLRDNPVGATDEVKFAVIGLSAKQVWPREMSP